MGPPPLLRAPGRGQNQMPEPASSTGSQGRNICFREAIVESVIRTTVLVANSHPLVLPPLEMVNVIELQCPAAETFPMVSISIRSGVEQWRPSRMFLISPSGNCHHETQLDI